MIQITKSWKWKKLRKHMGNGLAEYQWFPNWIFLNLAYTGAKACGIWLMVHLVY